MTEKIPNYTHFIHYCLFWWHESLQTSDHWLFGERKNTRTIL